MQSHLSTQSPLSTREVAALFGVTRYTITAWIGDGKIPATRVGARGHFRVNPEDVEALLGLTAQSKEEEK